MRDRSRGFLDTLFGGIFKAVSRCVVM